MMDTTRPEGRLIFGVFAALAEYERELISERTKAGIRAARRRGVHMGRPSKLTPHQIDHARGLNRFRTGNTGRGCGAAQRRCENPAAGAGSGLTME